MINLYAHKRKLKTSLSLSGELLKPISYCKLKLYNLSKPGHEMKPKIKKAPGKRSFFEGYYNLDVNLNRHAKQRFGCDGAAFAVLFP